MVTIWYRMKQPMVEGGVLLLVGPAGGGIRDLISFFYHFQKKVHLSQRQVVVQVIMCTAAVVLRETVQ